MATEQGFKVGDRVLWKKAGTLITVYIHGILEGERYVITPSRVNTNGAIANADELVSMRDAPAVPAPTDSGVKFALGDKVRSPAYGASWTGTVIEVRYLVRYGKHIDVEFTADQLELAGTAPASEPSTVSDGEATGYTTHSSPPATQTRMRNAYAAYRERAWAEYKTALDYVGWLESRVWN